MRGTVIPEDVMARKKSGKAKTAKVRDLSVRKASDAKGGSSVSNVLKALGDGVSAAARKG
jgi:hypothetical protein